MPSSSWQTSNTLHTSIAIGTATIATLSALIAYDRTYILKNPTIPGPRRLPFIGNILSWLPKIGNGKDHEIRKQHHDTYGPLVSFSAFGVEGVDVVDAEFNSQQLPGLKRTDIVAHVTKGIFRYALFVLPSDEIWKKHRKYLQPGFGPSHLRHGVEAANLVLNTLCGIWDTKLDPQSRSNPQIRINLFHIASSISFDIIGHVAFSFSYDSVLNYERPERQAALHSYNRAFEIAMSRLGLPESVWWLFGVSENQARKEMLAVKEAIHRAVQAKRLEKVSVEHQVHQGEEAQHVQADIEQEEGKIPGARTLLGMRKMDLLDRLLEVDGWSDDEIVDEIIAIFLAGGETTSNAIVFGIFELVRNPECLAKAREEVDGILGTLSGAEGKPAEVTWEAIEKLEYLDRVVKESLRLHPPLTTLPGREVHAKEGITIAGHHIQPGSIISANILEVHTSPRYWHNPLDFNPDRWIDFTPGRGTYLPFGEGPHKCLGYKLASLEIRVTLARLIHRYEFKLVENQKLELVTTSTHGFKKGILFD
ncbi:hypothetical protein HDV05_003293, partial [Chytridiales sp. JEL 0842]